MAMLLLSTPMLRLITISSKMMIKRLCIDENDVIVIGKDREETNVPIRVRLINAASVLTIAPSSKNGHLMELSGAPTSSIISISFLRFQIERYMAFIMIKKLATMNISIIVRTKFFVYVPMASTWSTRV